MTTFSTFASLKRCLWASPGNPKANHGTALGSLKCGYNQKITKYFMQNKLFESIFENNGRRNTNYQPEDWVDERAAAWTHVEEDDVKDAVAWLRKKKVKNPIKFSIRDEYGKDVTDQF